MEIETQGNPELKLVAKLIEGMEVAMLTTIADDGSLDSRPMAPLKMDASGVFWFFTDIRSEKVDRLRQANLAFSDETRSTYVSLAGHGEIDTERSRINKLWTPMAERWFPAGLDSPSLVLLRFVARRGEYWDAPASRMVRLATMAASAVAGQSSPESAQHGTFEQLHAGQLAGAAG